MHRGISNPGSNMILTIHMIHSIVTLIEYSYRQSKLQKKIWDVKCWRLNQILMEK